MKQIIICLSWYIVISLNSANACNKNYKPANRLLEIFEGNAASIYKQKVVVIKEHAFAAVYDTMHTWFVFYRPVMQNELPQLPVKKLSRFYKGYSIVRSVMFMNEGGEAIYYSLLIKNNKQVVLSFNDAGSIEQKLKSLQISS